MSAPAIECWVPGRPKTKGSMRVVNNRRGVLTEAVEGSTRWRQLVAYAMVAEKRIYTALSDVVLPFTGPVALTIEFRLPVEPIGSRAGDVDKLVRNIMDALSACSKGCADDCRNHAGVYVDDVQVCSLNVIKVGPFEDVGARIQVRAYEHVPR